MDTSNQNNNERKVGPIIGSLIIVLLLIVAALYFWGNRLNKETVEDIATPLSAAAINSTSSASGTKSDDIESLLEEVNTTSETSTNTTI